MKIHDEVRFMYRKKLRRGFVERIGGDRVLVIWELSHPDGSTGIRRTWVDSIKIINNHKEKFRQNDNGGKA